MDKKDPLALAGVVATGTERGRHDAAFLLKQLLRDDNTLGHPGAMGEHMLDILLPSNHIEAVEVACFLIGNGARHPQAWRRLAQWAHEERSGGTVLWYLAQREERGHGDLDRTPDGNLVHRVAGLYNGALVAWLQRRLMTTKPFEQAGRKNIARWASHPRPIDGKTGMHLLWEEAASSHAMQGTISASFQETASIRYLEATLVLAQEGASLGHADHEGVRPIDLLDQCFHCIDIQGPIGLAMGPLQPFIQNAHIERATPTPHGVHTVRRI